MNSEQPLPTPIDVEHPGSQSIRNRLAEYQQRLAAAKSQLLDAQIEDASTPRWKFWKERPFIPAYENSVKNEQSITNQTQEWSEKILAEYRRNTETALPHYTAYVAEQQRLAAETGGDPIILDPSQFILTYEDLGRHTRKSDVEIAKVAAALDFFKPKHDGPVRLPGVESYDNERLPRMELGSKNSNSAVAGAQEKGLTHMLRIQKDTKMTFGEARDIWRTYPTIDSKQVYIPISAETAQSLATLKAKDSVTLYMEGRYKDWPTIKGMIDFNFDILPIEEASEATKGISATLSYKRRNYSTGQEEPVTISLKGESPEELNEQALRHLIDLEMGTESVVAEGTEVTIGDSKMSWSEFDSLTRQPAQVTSNANNVKENNPPSNTPEESH